MLRLDFAPQIRNVFIRLIIQHYIDLGTESKVRTFFKKEKNTVGVVKNQKVTGATKQKIHTSNL